MAYKPVLMEPSTKKVTTLGDAAKSLAGQAGAGLWNLGARAATGIANIFADDRTSDQKYKDSVDAVQQTLGGSIGSPAGSTRIGIPTPSGTVPIVSFSLPGGQSTASAATLPTSSTTTIPQQPVTVTLGQTGMKPGKAKINLPTGVSKAVTPATTASPDTATGVAPTVGFGAVQTPGEYVLGEPKITHIPNVADGQANSDFGPDAVKSFPVPAGGGMASNGEDTYFLRGRTPTEEAARQAEAAAQPATAAPVLAAAPAPVTTYGDSTGVYQLAPGQNPPRDWGNATLGDIMSAKLNSKLALQESQVRGNDANVVHLGNTDAVAAFKAPAEVGAHLADTGYKQMLTGKGAAMTPLEMAALGASTNQTVAQTQEVGKKSAREDKNVQSEIEYRKGTLAIQKEKLGVLLQKVKVESEKAKRGDASDWHGISKSALEGIKLIDAKTAAGGELTPEEIQLRKNYVDTFNLAFTRQQRTSFAPQPQLGGEE